MILNFHGGAKIEAKRLFADMEIKYINTCSAVHIKAGEVFSASIEKGDSVLKGSLLGYSAETPVYASIAGVFHGIQSIDGEKYYVVINNGESGEENGFQPENRKITDLKREDIISAAKQYAIIDPRSGRPLWKLLSQLKTCRRLIVDCTEPFAHSAINHRLCKEKAKEIVFGAKLLLQASGSLKCVFAAEESKKDIIKYLSQYANDDKLFVTGFMEEKYPYGDGALMYGIYVQELKANQTAIDKKVLIVSPETAIALFEAMRFGKPQTYRYITLCGDEVNGGNFCVPRGMTTMDFAEICGGFPKDKLIIENTLLSGSPIKNAVNDNTMALIATVPEEKKRSDCIFCGKCAIACPNRLFPNEILSGGSKNMKKKCIACGACEYVCPGGIPLVRLIMGEEVDVNE